MKQIRQGEAAPSNGYFIEEDEARELLTALKVYRSERDYYKNAYESLNEEYVQSMEEVNARLQEVEKNLNAERRATKNREAFTVILSLITAGIGLAL